MVKGGYHFCLLSNGSVRGKALFFVGFLGGILIRGGLLGFPVGCELVALLRGRLNGLLILPNPFSPILSKGFFDFHILGRMRKVAILRR